MLQDSEPNNEQAEIPSANSSLKATKRRRCLPRTFTTADATPTPLDDEAFAGDQIVFVLKGQDLVLPVPLTDIPHRVQALFKKATKNTFFVEWSPNPSRAIALETDGLAAEDGDARVLMAFINEVVNLEHDNSMDTVPLKRAVALCIVNE